MTGIIFKIFVNKVNQEIYPFSAISGEGIEELLNQVILKLAEIPKEIKKIKVEEPEVITDFTIRIVKDNEVFVVEKYQFN